MPKRTVTITIKVSVRDYTKWERDEEGLDKEDCQGACAEFDGNDLAEVLAHHIEDEQDELLAGSGAYGKIVSVQATAEP